MFVFMTALHTLSISTQSAVYIYFCYVWHWISVVQWTYRVDLAGSDTLWWRCSMSAVLGTHVLPTEIGQHWHQPVLLSQTGNSTWRHLHTHTSRARFNHQSNTSSMHHCDCVALCKDISLQRGRLCTRSLASRISRSSEDRSSWVFFIQVVHNHPGGRLQFSGGGSKKWINISRRVAQRRCLKGTHNLASIQNGFPQSLENPTQFYAGNILMCSLFFRFFEAL